MSKPKTETEKLDVVTFADIVVTEPDCWFAVAGQEFSIVKGSPYAFPPTAGTVMTEGGPYLGRTRPITHSLTIWMRMKRAMLATVVERMDAWLALAEPIVEALEKELMDAAGEDQDQEGSTGDTPPLPETPPAEPA